jgi:hypothetical protein
MGMYPKVLLGSLAGASVTAGIVMFHNFEWQKPLLDFSSLQTGSVFLSALIGGMGFYEYDRDKTRARFWLQSYLVLFSMQFVFFGIESIRTKKSVVRYMHHSGTDAVMDGVAEIVVSVLLCALVLYYGDKKK